MRTRVVAVLGFLILGTSFMGCQQKMADQPSYKPLDPSDFFPDGRSARPLVPGTVARGHLRTDVAYYTGRKTRSTGQTMVQPAGADVPALKPKIQPKQPDAKTEDKNAYADFVDTFPFPMTEQVLEHGYHRYMIYCVVCHDPLGTGQGKIVERGYTRPPSYHIERLRTVPVGHIVAVIGEGYGSMPSYAAQIPVRDRWAITGYLRALQTSQHFPQSKLNQDMREERARQEKVPVSAERDSP